MNRSFVSWQWSIAILLLVWAASVSGQIFSNDIDERRENAKHEYDQGNYRDAFTLYRALLMSIDIETDEQAKAVANDFGMAVYCLSYLGENDRLDNFLEAIISRYQSQWRVLVQASRSYADIEKYGYMIAGEFKRGHHRGGGHFVRADQHDRVKSLQLYMQAWELLKSAQQQGANLNSELFDVLVALSAKLREGDREQSWSLQVLTDLNTLPDFEEAYYSRHRQGAPVDSDGEPVTYAIPRDFASAINDGERWRFVLSEIANIDQRGQQWSRWTWADFAWQQFGVHTMASSINWYNQNNTEDALATEKSIFDLQGLGDRETIAQLATGIKRFVLPEDYDYFSMYQQLAEEGSYKSGALERLAAIYENRRQLPKAADYWRRAIAVGTPNHSYPQQRLDQIVGAWAQFEPLKFQAQSNQQKQVGLRFRNATSVKFTARRINSERFLNDIKRYLQSDPGYIAWEKIDIARLGQQLLDQDSSYRGSVLSAWSQTVNPLADHQDSHVAIDLPGDFRGTYLLEAEVAGGNTNYIVVWNSDAIIVKKPMKDGEFYFVADSLTGQPLADQSLHFFGYHEKWLDHEENDGKREREVIAQEFKVTTDKQGQVVVNKEKLDQSYQWLVHTDAGDDDFAFLGFQSIWYGDRFQWQDQQTKAYIVSSQPAYRPGQTVELSAWIQTATYSPEDDQSLANRQFTLRVYNPRGDKIVDQNVTSDKFGGVSHSITLPDDAGLGIYGIEIVGINGRGHFRVEEYKKPEFEVVIDTPEEPAALGDTIRAKINARYYFGTPVSEATVKIKIERFDHNSQWFPYDPWDWLYGNGYWWFAGDLSWYPGWHHWGMRSPRPSWIGPRYNAQPELVQEFETKIGRDGTAELLIDTESALLMHGDKDHRYHISVEVVDSSRRSVYAGGDVLVSRKPYQVFSWVDKGYYQVGDEVKASFHAQTLDLKPVQGEGTAELYRLGYDESDDDSYEENGKVQETLVQEWTLNNNEEGRAQLSLKADLPGQHRLLYRLRDGRGNSQEGAYLFNVVAANSISGSDYRFSSLEIIPDRTHYAPGDTLNLMVNSEQENAHVLLFERPMGNYDLPQPIVLDGKSTIRSLEIDAKDRPNFYVEAITVFNGEVYSAIKEIAVPPQQSLVNVAVSANQDEYQPGEQAEVEVTLTDEQGDPFIGSTIIAVYDKALDYIGGDTKPPSIREFFWQWKRHHYPTFDNSSQLQFRSLVRSQMQAMQPVGAFGERVLYELGYADGDTLEEIVTEDKRSRSNNKADVGAPMVARMASAPSSEAEPGQPSEQNTINPTIDIRTNFVDSAFWQGHVITDSNGKANVSFKMPDNLTTWLTSVWAIGENAQVGQATEELISSKKLLLRLQAPRFFIEKDEVVLSANVHNYLENAEEIKISLQLDGEEIELIESNTANQQVRIDANGEHRIDWRVKVKREGLAKIRMLAQSIPVQSNSTPSTKTHSDAVEMGFPVYVHGQLITQSFSGALNRDQKQGQLTFTIPEQRRPEQSRLELRYSPTLAGAMVDALPYLVDYPYSCTEQTLSRFLPTVLVQDILKKTGVDLDTIKNKQTNLNAQEIGDDQARGKQWSNSQSLWSAVRNPVFDQTEVEKMSRAGLNRLVSMQLSDGGWGWFSGWGEQSSPHTTAHVVHGLQVAKRVGLDVDDNSLQRGIDWLNHYQAQQVQELKNADTETNPYKDTADNVDAFIAMVLADAETNASAMLDALMQDRNYLSVYGKSMLALTLDTVGRESDRDVVRQNIEQFLKQDDENQTAYLDLDNGSYWWYWYGSENEAQAYYLKLLARVDPKGQTASRLVKYLLNNRKNAGYWSSTRDTAVVIEAMTDYLIASGETAPNYTLDVKLNNEIVKTVELNKDNLFHFDNKLVIEGLDLNAGEQQLALIKRGEGPLYYNAYVNNFSLEDHIEKQGLELKVQRRYYLLKPIDASNVVAGSSGQAVSQSVEKYQRFQISENTELASGDLVEIELLIDSKNDYEYILIEDMKAAGFEPLEVRSGYNTGDGKELHAYVEYRDNRVAFFAHRIARGTHSLTYRMKAEIPGKFSALPAKIEAMYAPELKGNSDENRLKIVE